MSTVEPEVGICNGYVVGEGQDKKALTMGVPSTSLKLVEVIS
jgi:hypothetical protein